jgi:Domain of unknown function (DUF4395)
MTVKSSVRNRIEAQGFCGLDDATLRELAPWIRWTYTLGTLVTVIGVVTVSPAVLWTLAAITSVGIFLPFHPFDLLYNHGIRYLTGTGPFPDSGPQRHFVFVIATIWLVATGWAFGVDATVTGIALSGALILVGTLASVTHFCIPSFIYNAVVHRRSQHVFERGS